MNLLQEIIAIASMSEGFVSLHVRYNVNWVELVQIIKSLTKWQFSGDSLRQFSKVTGADLVLSCHTEEVVVAFREFADDRFQCVGAAGSSIRPHGASCVTLLNNVASNFWTAIILRSLPSDGDTVLVHIGHLQVLRWWWLVWNMEWRDYIATLICMCRFLIQGLPCMVINCLFILRINCWYKIIFREYITDKY